MRWLNTIIIFALWVAMGYAQSDLPREQQFDGVPMVYVPDGCFIMGTDEGYVWEPVAHEVCMDTPFWIDRYEVSNAQFERLAGKAEEPSSTSNPDDPRTNIMWVEAQRYCEARGGRLPTEAEWAYAARGTESRRYPWGNSYHVTGGNFCDVNCPHEWRDADYEDGYAQLAPVGRFPFGASWVGAEDMSGNVWEWTHTRYDPEHYPDPYRADDGRETSDTRNSARILRGGSWDSLPDRTPLTVRLARYAFYDVSDTIGFRCVRDVEMGE